MTMIKICGVRDAATLRLLGDLCADYAGFVFAESRRRVTPKEAGELLRRVPHHPDAVGVFVNPDRQELDAVLAHVPLKVIQLHGQEPPSFCAEVRSRYNAVVWKALGVRSGSEMARDIDRYRSVVDAFLFDTHDPVVAGGTGRCFSWDKIPLLSRLADGKPFFVAGGITPDNIGELLANYRPQAVDISSGVETDGAKDPDKIRDLVERVRAYDQNNRCV
ncbi:MAG: phosphoribosylanthranilate isomerase [Brevibacillus sp.]|nr:phosphoribosylanthranilate isomerase [Brevibacillus sp.]